MGFPECLATNAGTTLIRLTSVRGVPIFPFRSFLQHQLIVGLSHLETNETTRLAMEWASRWLFTNYVGFNNTGHMFEKVSFVAIEMNFCCNVFL